MNLGEFILNTKPHCSPQTRALNILFPKIPGLVWGMLIVLGLAAFGQKGALAAWGVVAFWTLRGPDEAIEGLLLALLLVFLNPHLTSSREIASTARWGIMLIAAIRVTLAWLHRPHPWPAWSMYLLLFAGYTAIASPLISWWPATSLTKLVTFVIVVLVPYFGIKLGRKDWQRNLTAYGMVIALLSVPLIFSPLGYALNGYQFQGILNHPQAYGIILSILMAAVIGRWLLNPGVKVHLWQITVLLLMGGMVVLSGARTGYFALALAFGVTLILQRSMRDMLKRAAFHPLTYLFLVGLVVYLGFTQPMDEINRLIFERSTTTYDYYDLPVDYHRSVVAYLLASKSSLIFHSWNNFLDNPLLGIGFGCPSSRIPQSSIPTVAGIPIGISREKGFMGTAILEEVGILGAVLLLGLVIAQFRVISKRGLAGVMLLFLTAIFVNLGESLYFAAGGMGILVHIAIAVALVSAEQA